MMMSRTVCYLRPRNLVFTLGQHEAPKVKFAELRDTLPLTSTLNSERPA